MLTAKLLFKQPNDVANFVKLASKCEYDIDIKKGSALLDGKSLEGLYALQLNTELKCILHTESSLANEFINSIQEYLVSNFTEE